MNLSDLSEEKKSLIAMKLMQKRNGNLSNNKIMPVESKPDVKDFMLSSGQKRFFLLDQLLEEKSVYNTSFRFLMKGNLDLNILEKSFEVLFKTHKILNSYIFVNDDGEPFLRFHDENKFKIKEIQLKNKLKDENALNEIIEKETKIPFNLEKDILIRVLVINTAKNEFHLVIIMHHIITDAWSFRVLLKDLEILYNSFFNNTEPVLDTPDIQFHDFAYWQQQRLNGVIMDNLVSYWKEKLKNCPNILNLTTDFPRPQMQTYNGATYRFVIPEEINNGIKKISEKFQVTQFVVTFTGFIIMLYRFTMQEDILVGIPIAGRSRPEVQKMIGLFINTLVLRSDLSGDPAVEELIDRVKKTVLESFAHEEMPFEKLLEILDVERNLSHSALFQVMFNYHRMDRMSLELENIESESIKSEKNISKFDLELSIRNRDEELIGYFNYNTDLFTESTIERYEKIFIQILKSIIENQSQKISGIQILPESYLKQLEQFSNGYNKINNENKFIYELFEEQVKKTPNAVALVCDNKSFSYKELNEKANQLANYLVKHGVKSESKVVILLNRNANYVLAMLAVIKAQGVYIPLDTMFPVDRIQYIINDADAQILITESEFIENYKSTDKLKTIDIIKDRVEIADENKKTPEMERNIHDLMYIIYTSGTTGQPKGVCVENINYSTYLPNVLKRLGLIKKMSYAIVSTFAADLGSTVIWGSLVTGGSLHVIPYELSIDPDAYSNYVSKNKIEVIKIVPSHLESLFSSINPEKVLPKKLLILAGEASTWELVSKINKLNHKVKIINSYGPTETTVSATLYDVVSKQQNQHTSYVPIGKPYNVVETYILDNNYQKVPVGIPGELYIGGPLITRGYLNRKELNDSKFIQNPYSEAKAKIYKTGDLVRYLEDGNIEFLERIDDQVKIKGYRIELGEIESVICEHDAVLDAVAGVRTDENDEKHLVAYIVLKNNDEKFKTESISAFLKDKLPHYMIPHIYMIIDEIPLNANGKVDRFKLPEIDIDSNISNVEYVEPVSELEKYMAGIWSEVLKKDKIGLYDNFFNLGGDSFKAFKMLTLVRKKYKNLRVADLFMYPVLNELAEFMESINDVERGLLNKLTKTNNNTDLTYLCIPFASGSPIMYQSLADHLSENTALYALEFPGRETGEVDTPLETLANQCVEESLQIIKTPVIVYGHCMGGPLALEIARLLEQKGANIIGVFLGGVFPVLRLPGKFFDIWAKLFPNNRRRSDKAIVEMMITTGGLTDELDKESEEFMIKSFRHYQQEVEDYYLRSFNDKDFVKLKAPIISVVGEMDRLTTYYQERYLDWKYFSDEVYLEVIPEAGHFFQIHQSEELFNIINNKKDFILKRAKPEEKEVESLIGEQEKIYNADFTDGMNISKNKIKSDTENVKENILNFFLVVFGQFISIMGSSLSGFAMGIWVYQKTGSVMNFATVLLIQRLPEIIMLPLAGALVDKWDRRKIMLTANIIASIGTLFLFTMQFTHNFQIWNIYLFTLITSITGAFHRPAYQSSIAQLVPKRYLGNANGLIQLSNSFGNVIAPILGGVLIIIIKLDGIILLDFISFAVAFVTLVFAKFPKRMVLGLEEPIIKAIVGGFKFIFHRKSFVIMVIFFFIANIFLGIGNVLITPLVLSFSNSASLGIIVSLTAFGSIAGGMIMAIWGGFKRRATGMIGFNILMGIAYIIIGFSPNIIFPMIGVFLYGLSLILINAHWQSLIQVKVGLDLQGRFFAINELMARISIPFGFVVGGFISEKIFEPFMKSGLPLSQFVSNIIGSGNGRGIALLIIVVGIIRGLMGIIGLRIKSFRYMEDILPDMSQDFVIIKDKDKLQELADKKLAYSKMQN
jgi:amino acid adenylation domain-containing protein